MKNIEELDLGKVQSIIEESSTIDRNNMDKMLETHSARYEYVTRFLPDLKNLLNSTKMERNEKKADLYLQNRMEKEKRGEKFTEAMLEALVTVHPEYRELNRKVLELEYKVSIIDRGWEVFRSREAAMKIMAQLYADQYWTISS